MNAEIADRLEKSFDREKQRFLRVQTATTALTLAGVPVPIPFAQAATEPVEQSPRHHQVSRPVYLRLRFNEGLRRRLEEAADKNRWPMTAEIIERLEKSFQTQDQQDLIDEDARAALKGEGMRQKDKAP
jgi:hypothetical protein